MRTVGKLLDDHVVCWVESLTFLGATLKDIYARKQEIKCLRCLKAIWKSVGLLQLAHYVLGLPNGELGRVFRLRPSPPTTAQNWPGFLRQCASGKLLTVVLEALGRVLTRSARSCTAIECSIPNTNHTGWWHLFSDASKSGGGVVLTRRLDTQASFSLGWKWSQKRKRYTLTRWRRKPASVG